MPDRYPPRQVMVFKVGLDPGAAAGITARDSQNSSHLLAFLFSFGFLWGRPKRQGCPNWDIPPQSVSLCSSVRENEVSCRVPTVGITHIR